MPPRTLDQLSLGESASIAALRGETAITQRIMALGLLPGSNVRVVGVAPLGDPFTIESAAGRISIRRREARAIELA
jgi:ferrous iron transport protein A